MNILQLTAPDVDSLGLAVGGFGHLLACAVAVAVGAGASRRRLDGTRVLAGGLLAAIGVPAVAAVGVRTGVLAPVVGATGDLTGTYVLVAGLVVLGGVAGVDAATRPRWRRRGVRTEGRRSSMRDTAIGVLAGTVALLSGELATLAVVGAL